MFLPVSPGGTQTQKTNTHKEEKVEATRTLFGVQLSPGATKLLNQVQTLYGSPIREVENPSLAPSVHAQSIVRIDGVPEIQINPVNGRLRPPSYTNLCIYWGMRKESVSRS
jgi:hypothetical protein